MDQKLWYFTVTSIVGGEAKNEGFFLNDEIDLAMERLDKVAIRHFGADHWPIENGTIGFQSSSGDKVILEEKEIKILKECCDD